MSEPKITIEQVRHVALLSRLALTDAEAEKMRSELDAILGYVASIEELPVSGVEPTCHAVPITAPLRADVVAPSLLHAEALAAAPSAECGAFAVPRVLEGD